MTNKIKKINLYLEEEKRSNRFDIGLYLFKIALFLIAYSLLFAVYRGDSFVVIIVIYFATIITALITIYRNYFKKIIFVEHRFDEFHIIFRSNISKFTKIISSKLTVELCHLIPQKDMKKYHLLKVKVSSDSVQNEIFRISVIDFIDLLFFLKSNKGNIIYDYDLRDLLKYLFKREDFFRYHEKIKFILE